MLWWCAFLVSAILKEDVLGFHSSSRATTGEFKKISLVSTVFNRARWWKQDGSAWKWDEWRFKENNQEAGRGDACTSSYELW